MRVSGKHVEESPLGAEQPQNLAAIAQTCLNPSLPVAWNRIAVQRQAERVDVRIQARLPFGQVIREFCVVSGGASKASRERVSQLMIDVTAKAKRCNDLVGRQQQIVQSLLDVCRDMYVECGAFPEQRIERRVFERAIRIQPYRSVKVTQAHESAAQTRSRHAVFAAPRRNFAKCPPTLLRLPESLGTGKMWVTVEDGHDDDFAVLLPNRNRSAQGPHRIVRMGGEHDDSIAVGHEKYRRGMWLEKGDTLSGGERRGRVKVKWPTMPFFNAELSFSNRQYLNGG